MCAGLCIAGTPHLQLFFFFFVLFAAAAAVCCLYHTAPQALKLSNLRQQRYDNSRTSCSSFVTATGGASVCVHMRVRVRVRAMLPMVTDT